MKQIHGKSTGMVDPRVLGPPEILEGWCSHLFVNQIFGLTTEENWHYARYTGNWLAELDRLHVRSGWWLAHI